MSFSVVLSLSAGSSLSTLNNRDQIAASEPATDGRQNEPTRPCDLAQLPVPVANKIAGYCRYNEMVEELQRQPKVREQFFLRDNDFYRRVDQESRISSFFNQNRVVVGPRAMDKWYTHIPYVNQFNFAGNSVLLIEKRIAERGSLPEVVTLLLAKLNNPNNNIPQEKLIGFKNLTPPSCVDYKVLAFTLSKDEQNIFYIESINNGPPRLVHQEKQGDSWRKKRIIVLPKEKYQEIAHFTIDNKVALLKSDRSVIFVSLVGKKENLDEDQEDGIAKEYFDGKQEADDNFELNEINFLEQLLQDKGVCKTLAASLALAADKSDSTEDSCY